MQALKFASKDALVLDFFAGSGTTGVASLEFGRQFILVDKNTEALEVMAKRFDGVPNIEWVDFDPKPYQKIVVQEQSTPLQVTMFDVIKG